MPKMARTPFCLPSRPPAKGCPARLRACVGVVKPCTRGVVVGMCMNAPFLAGATLVIVHLDRREVGGESEGYARCRRCRVASILVSAKGSRHAFGIAQSTRKECIHLRSHSGPIHGLTWRI